MPQMAEKRDYYEVLSVERSASQAEIASSYRKLAIKFHPDSNPGDEDATTKFKEAAEAYEVLNDAEKRARYDQYGHAGVNGAGSQFRDAEDIFEAFGDMFSGGIFGDLFGGGGRQRRRQRKGGDIRCDVTLELEEAARGVTKSVDFKRSVRCDGCQGSGAASNSGRETCNRCGGRGQVVQSAGILRVQTTCPTCQGAGAIITDPCRDCHGNGYTQDNVHLDVAIPAGIDDGMRIRLTGEGEPSPHGGPNGDCYCFVTVRPHRVFQRDGQHLILQLPITYSQAALGATIEVPTLNGADDLKIPHGTQSGEVFRLHSQGMPDPRGRHKGDLLVQTFIEVPKKLTAEQKKLLRELAELEHTHVTPQRKSVLEKLKEYITGSETEAEN